MGICSKCGNVIPTFDALCGMCNPTALKVYSPRLKAYEKPELFEPVDLDLNDDDDDDAAEALGKFVLPVCIEAVPACIDSEVLFLVRSETKFWPGKKDAMLFHTPKEAQQFIDEKLKPRHNNWTFVIWSLSALIK